MTAWKLLAEGHFCIRPFLHTASLATWAASRGKHLVVANAGSDTLSVMDTRTDRIVETISVRQSPGDPFGAQPDALVINKSGDELFVCNGTAW